MDVIRLGLAGTTAYLPTDIIDGYSSMIWTERFQSPGEFQMTTAKVDETLALLPEKTMISTLETDEVMMVETREIEVDDTGNPTLVVRGRTVDSIFEKRHVHGPYQKRRKMAKSYPPSGAAGVLMWNAVDNYSDRDVTRAGDFFNNPLDQLPNVMITTSVSDDGNVKRRWLQEGPLYNQLYDILVRWDLGLRSIRPISSSGTQIGVATGLATRGTVTKTPKTDIAQLRFDLYNGLDRSHLQSVLPVVAFNTLHDHIDSAKYLFTVKDHRTACRIMSPVGNPTAYRSTAQSLYSGWDRKVMSYNAGTPEFPPEPLKPEAPTAPKSTANQAAKDAYDSEHDAWVTARNAWWPLQQAWNDEVADITAEFLEDAEDEALREMKKHRRVSLFTGDISPRAPYKYKTDYNLGDLVSLYGDYGQVEQMLVTEYIRTEDAEGDRGYPGLTLP